MDAAAYHQGFSEAYVYDACNPPVNDQEKESYIMGYADGMDVNLQVEGGVAHQTEWEKELLTEVYR